jgi:predicted ABC-type transport system involved in lysophospholipase L1 biosynthesis ATPase subunit
LLLRRVDVSTFLVAPVVLDLDRVELSSQILLHKFNSRSWLKHIQKASAALVDADDRGLARTFQLTRPFAGMSVVENVEVACLAPRVRHFGKPRERAHALLNQVGLGDRAKLEVDVLSYGDLRRLEIARALATKPQLLLLDEPFAGLGVSEVGPLADLIRTLHQSEGLAILIIEDKLASSCNLYMASSPWILARWLRSVLPRKLCKIRASSRLISEGRKANSNCGWAPDARFA